jgi:hypothetical protein
MGRIRHVFPGGNTSQGFFSFYEYMVKESVKRKMILKGGPGVGKSTFMKKVGQYFADRGVDVEYHWCSSDNDSLDGVVIGRHEICLLDGTAPHVIDPRFPGAVDEIVNIGQFWSRDIISEHRGEIIALSSSIAGCFARAYLRLNEAWQAYQEWSSLVREGKDAAAANRNVGALAEDFLRGSSLSHDAPRHLFAAAITPQGVVNHIESLIDNNYSFFGAKGSPGSGIKDLFQHTAYLIELNHTSAEIYHSPLVPQEIDCIVLPEQKTVMIDMSSTIVEYERSLPQIKFKRWLDFDQFVNWGGINSIEEHIESSQKRLRENISAAVAYIKEAKQRHDLLETYYIPAMDFAGMDGYREGLQRELLKYLN